MKDEFQVLFVQLLLACEELDLLGKTVFVIIIAEEKNHVIVAAEAFCRDQEQRL